MPIRTFLFTLAATMITPLVLFAQDPTPTPAAAAPAPEVKLPAQKDFYLFLLAGQSNMAGRGKVDAEGKTPKPRIYAINKDLNWQPAVDPLHWDKTAAGAGIGRPFAEVVLATLPENVSIGLVPTAWGGSSITTWVPGGFHKETNSHPYDDFLVRAKRAMKDGTVKAILWHQGESDAGGKNADPYEQRLTDLIARMRTDLGMPDLPFIIGELGKFPAKPWNADREKIDAAHQAVAKKLKNVYYVKSEGLTSSDNLHFDTPSLRVLGKSYAEAYLKYVEESSKAGSAAPAEKH
ncbi:MAG: sialate O-acetylesterase [Candidatus Methylacidiphilales bacterium]|nr:sialate O-acetylesterase [Candidatus Methylacidiphilales bacterium]